MLQNESTPKMRYRLGLDLGSSSLGWAMLRLNEHDEPYAVIRAGVRIFSNGRDPKTEASLAVARRLARQMRRTRDRKLCRKNQLIETLVAIGFFPSDVEERRALASLDPYKLRAEGLDRQLTPSEFARALFHLAQRRGFKSNRKTDGADNEVSVMKSAIAKTITQLQAESCRTVGEWLYKRHQQKLTTRARLRTFKDDSGKGSTVYDFYLNRALIEAEFDAIWDAQQKFNAVIFTAERKETLRDIIFYQRDLRPVDPGRCTLFPEERRAPLALIQQQEFRIYQEVNNLRKVDATFSEEALSLQERDLIANALQRKAKLTFTSIRKLIGYSGPFNLEGEDREELKGNLVNAVLSGNKLFGDAWFCFTDTQKNEILDKLLTESSEEKLCQWISANFSVDATRALAISNAKLPKGYGNLSKKALDLILPFLKAEVITYDEAVKRAGLSHSELNYTQQTGEILPELPYYGEYLTRHVGFGSNNVDDPPEKRYGKIANPTVHIALNQVRVVLNALIRRYGKPSQIVIELARELKQSKDAKIKYRQTQNTNRKRNERIRADIAKILGGSPEDVSAKDVEKWILWEELNLKDATARCCPYSGKQISVQMLLTDAIEVDHILPFSRTLDDSKNNKVVCLREANRIKGNRTPWEAKDDFQARGWDSESMLLRVEFAPRSKRFRFGEDGYKTWLKEFSGFEARALADTQYMSRVAREYLQLICPSTWSIPGQLTGMLRGKLGLNSILGLTGEKNRDDHRHHAVDACVIALTDRGMLQKMSAASARAEEQHLSRLLELFDPPWASFREHVERAIGNIQVSHRPDHSYEGAMHDDTNYGILPEGRVRFRKDGHRITKPLSVIPITCPKASWRHGCLADGTPKPYKGLKGNSNFCIEIVLNEKGKWDGDVISTFDAYQIVRTQGKEALYGSQSRSEKPLVMRLMRKDIVRMAIDGKVDNYLLQKISQSCQLFFIPLKEANVSERCSNGSLAYISKTPGSLQKTGAIPVSISPIGIMRKRKV